MEDAWEASVCGAVWRGCRGDRPAAHMHFQAFVLRIMGSSREGKSRVESWKVLDLNVTSVTNWLLIGTLVIVMETSNCSKNHLLLGLNKFITSIIPD